MDLNELKKQLYKKDGRFDGRPQLPEELAPGHETLPSGAPEPSWSGETDKGFYLSVKEKRILVLALAGAFLAIAAIAGWFIWRDWRSFETKDVALDIFGQERVVSGEELNYIVRYKNNSKTAIENAILTFSFPGQSMPADLNDASQQKDSYILTKNLGGILAGQEGQAEFKVRVLGDKDSVQRFSAKLNYRPSNINSNFENSAEFSSAIISVPLVLSFILPERVVSGQTIDFSLRYLNTSDASFSDVKLKIDYPEGFVFDAALPGPGESDNVWDLPEIGSREEGNIVIKGTVSGNEGDSKIFKAQIGLQKDDEDFIVYSRTLSSPRISVSPLFVEQELPGNAENIADAGQYLTYKIKYRNTTDVAIGPVFITAKIDSRAADQASVSAAGGFFNSSDSTITWNSSSIPSLELLEAGQEGEVQFSLRVAPKEKLPVRDFSDKNFTVKTIAKINSFNVPLALSGTQLAGQNELIVKINSPLVLEVKGYYNDQLFPNSGPLPPRVGQKTTYTIYWQLLNISNDVSGVAVEGYLPSYVSWEGKIFPSNEDIKYDASSGKITWRVNNLAAGAGVLSLVRQAAFQVGFTPSLSQVGSLAVVAQKVEVAAQDDFTGERLAAGADVLKTDMPDDATVGDERGRVGQ